MQHAMKLGKSVDVKQMLAAEVMRLETESHDKDVKIA